MVKKCAQTVMDTIAAAWTTSLADAGYVSSGAVAEEPAAEGETLPDGSLSHTSVAHELVIQVGRSGPGQLPGSDRDAVPPGTGIQINVDRGALGQHVQKDPAEWTARAQLRHGRRRLAVDGSGRVPEGHYVDMTAFLADNNLADTVTPATLKYDGSTRRDQAPTGCYPTEGDADGWAYRTDIVDDPDEMEAFEAKYGYAYSIPPKDYNVPGYGRVLPSA